MNITRSWPAIRYGLAIFGVAISLAVRHAAWAEAGSVTDDNVVERITTMKTPTDHEAIAEYYRTKAAAAAADTTRHEAMMKSYGGNGMKTMNRHCDLLIQTARQQQAEYESLAKAHAEFRGTPK